jgi:hypothetical protein
LILFSADNPYFMVPPSTRGGDYFIILNHIYLILRFKLL